MIALPNAIIPVLEFLILFSALFIVSTTTIGHIIDAYRLQTGLLGVLAVISIAQSWVNFPHFHLFSVDGLFIAALVAWPIILIFLIKRSLMLATVSETKWRMTIHDVMEIHRAWTEASFRRGKPTMGRMGASMIAFLALVVFAFVIAFPFVPTAEALPNRVGLGVALALQFAGLFTMMTKRDIISQVVGLFVMDHGMYLAMILLIEMPSPAGDFLLALYLYTFITILLLFFILPNLRRVKGRIDLDALGADSELKG